MSSPIADYPGRILDDSERTPFGLGWEYARREWPGNAPAWVLRSKERTAEFCDGFKRFVCSDRNVNQAMLTKGKKIKRLTEDESEGGATCRGLC